MEFQTILVELDDDAACADRIRVAGDLARRFSSHVLGLTATGFRLEPFRSVGEEARRYAEAAQQTLRQRAQMASEQFTRVLAEAAPGVTHSHRLVEEEAGWALATTGRVADIVVVRQPLWPASTPPLASEPAEYALLNAGRPLLVVPEGVRSCPAIHVMIAWDGGREAARAVADAMPFLRRADRVTAVAMTTPERQEEGAPLEDLLVYLRRHGVDASGINEPDTPQPGPALLAVATTLSADLIVAGGYGHSRMRELMMGGATRSLIRASRVLVLLSH
ncbi:Universal stress protein [Cupriavidus sp. H18C1]|uniref:universal stress protein n=1 Tax=Cupriavidus sp. H18C1 TaxID=3241601 RepID=UPI003BB8AC90